MNLYQVINETDLVNILKKNDNNLVVVMITNSLTFERETSNKLKKLYVEISKNFPKTFFVYIDIKNFNDQSKYFTDNIAYPRFIYYFRNDELGYVEGLDLNVFVEKLQLILSKLNEIKEVNETKTYFPKDDKNISPQELGHIIDLKIKLKKMGNNVSLLHLFENHNKNKANNSENDMFQQQQLQKLNQLNHIKNMMQAKQMKELQKLRKLKQIKEMNKQEENNKLVNKTN